MKSSKTTHFTSSQRPPKSNAQEHGANFNTKQGQVGLGNECVLGVLHNPSL